MVVDVAQIKSCWVGESEKNIRKAFERYRAYVKEAERAPILLFNEADAVLGIRQEGASRAVEKMENSLQNIILQEMEQLDGHHDRHDQPDAESRPGLRAAFPLQDRVRTS